MGSKRLPVSISSAVFIEDSQGRLLLLKQAAEEKGGKWGPPAGGMEAHEDPIMATHREVLEEINVKVTLDNLVGIYTVDRGSDKSGIAFVFRGRIVSGEILPATGEISEFRFFSPNEIRALDEEGLLYKPEYNRCNIQDWLEGKSFPIDVISSLKVGN